MVGGLVEEEDVGVGGELGCEGEAASPSAGERLGGDGGVGVGEAGAPEGLVDAGIALERLEMIGGDGGGDDVVRRGGGWELGLLRDVPDAGVAAKRDGATVGLDLSGEDFEERRFSRAGASGHCRPLAFG